MLKYRMFLHFPRTVRDIKKKCDTQGESPRATVSLRERKEEKDADRSCSGCLHCVYALDVFRVEIGGNNWFCQSLFLGLLDDFTAAKGDRNASGASRPRTGGVNRRPFAAHLPSLDGRHVPSATVDLVPLRPLPEALPPLWNMCYPI